MAILPHSWESQITMNYPLCPEQLTEEQIHQYWKDGYLGETVASGQRVFSIKDMDGVAGTWIALDDVTVDNGCMHVLPGQHRLGPLRHHHTFDCEILPDRIDPSKAVPVELKAGGMLIFHSNLPHQTPANSSPLRRRALQYHYRQRENAIIPTEEFDSIFKEADWTPASCSAAQRFGF